MVANPLPLAAIAIPSHRLEFFRISAVVALGMRREKVIISGYKAFAFWPDFICYSCLVVYILKKTNFYLLFLFCKPVTRL